MPFLADELYQNLVRSVRPSSAESVHLAEWPAFHETLIDEALNRDMALVIKLVSLGHAARQKANRKVRQPLQEAAFSVGTPSERHAVEVFSDLIEDELNVKEVRLLDTSVEVVSHTLKPLPKQLGQKYGNVFPAIKDAILQADPEASARSLLGGQPIRVEVGAANYEILADEVQVRAQAREGFAVAEEGPYVAALVTSLTPELRQEGLAREVVRRVQELRKTADLDVADRIQLYVSGSGALHSAVSAYEDYVRAETLATSLEFRAAPDGAQEAEADVDGEHLRIGLTKSLSASNQSESG
jgi:isoleucyl-tRNA synthetase